MFRKETNKLKMTIYYILYILSSSLSRNGTIVKFNYKLLAFSHFTAISMQNKKKQKNSQRWTNKLLVTWISTVQIHFRKSQHQQTQLTGLNLMTRTSQLNKFEKEWVFLQWHINIMSKFSLIWVTIWGEQNKFSIQSECKYLHKLLKASQLAKCKYTIYKQHNCYGLTWA